MAYTAADLTADELTRLTANKPIISSKNKGYPFTSAEWNGTGLVGTNINDAAYPTSRSVDGHLPLITRPASVQPTAMFLVFRFPSPGIDFDFVVISKHNALSLGTDPNVLVFIADDGNFSVNALTVASFSPVTTSKRLVNVKLQDNGAGTFRRYTGVEYARVKFSWLGGGSFKPELGEVFFGRRRQLPRNPDVPWNDKRETSRVSDFETRSGLRTRFVFNKGRAERSAFMPLDSDADIAMMDSWWDDTEEGTEPFFWIENPNTTPSAYLMRNEEAAYNFPLVGPYERDFQVNMLEQATFVSQE